VKTTPWGSTLAALKPLVKLPMSFLAHTSRTAYLLLAVRPKTDQVTGPCEHDEVELHNQRSVRHD
jgi:hypothetical protein